jgi:AbrB family looped-hinge helix DNA binding protein
MVNYYHFSIYGRMEAVTKIDKAGRVVIPKQIRERMNLKEDSSLLVTESGSGVLLLKKLDIEELGKRLRKELKGVEVERIARKVEEESNERARKAYKVLRH